MVVVRSEARLWLLLLVEDEGMSLVGHIGQNRVVATEAFRLLPVRGRKVTFVTNASVGFVLPNGSFDPATIYQIQIKLVRCSDGSTETTVHMGAPFAVGLQSLGKTDFQPVAVPLQAFLVWKSLADRARPKE